MIEQIENVDWTIEINKDGNIELTLQSMKYDLPVLEITDRKSADRLIHKMQTMANQAFGHKKMAQEALVDFSDKVDKMLGSLRKQTALAECMLKKMDT